MRMIWILFLASVGACGGAYADPAFKAGQVWRLEAAEFANALVTIGSVKSRGEQTVVHISISGLPGPPTDSPLFSAIFRDIQGLLVIRSLSTTLLQEFPATPGRHSRPTSLFLPIGKTALSPFPTSRFWRMTWSIRSPDLS